MNQLAHSFCKLLLAAILVLMTVSAARAKIANGLVCSTCHTMHYSQAGDVLAQWGTSGPYGALLTNDCIGCHTGSNSGATIANNEAPYVFDSSGGLKYNSTGTEVANRNSLAGGNFFWTASGNDAGGHNLVNNPGFDTRFTGDTIPGSATDYATAYPNGLKCAGTSGCHGSRSVASEMQAVKKTHHSDDSTIDGTTIAKSYRFLSGIVGKEDSDWEFTVAYNDHNQYLGQTIGSAAAATNTITGFCKNCHGTFHSGTGGSSPWTRHPTEIDIAAVSYNGTEFDGYSTYDPVAPVASTSYASLVTNDVQTANNGIVTCISCHRAHGTPWSSILRWNFKGWPGGGYDGCGICHTSKN